MKRSLYVLMFTVFIVAVLAGCSKGGSNQATTQTNTSTKEIVITAKNMNFEPNNITVDKGTKVKITFRNEENVDNSLTIEGTNIKIENVGPKKEQSTEFVADQEGEFKIVATAAGMGSMTGKLTVK